ncbi:endoglucanase [Kitasatospora sp. SolWspMP-SS2h]|uniref:GH12 family glycosyl hydrolase domain-containing protein n=1 Tax=Kitasatospora sp. SolWspMP-SS2h TaxID=1305729 RepID=UPI000DBA7DB9|nr:ricin-type beta-trefoil lectin domain protein [Kitasatospora sp. SolWspMP-SS2h]RAJ46887.1 endoglucanase [Kitasatospora sp. SolWspMP-SS2h]
MPGSVLVRTLRAALTAFTLVAAATVLPVAAAGPAGANTTICDTFGSTPVSNGAYIVQNNEWGDSIQQCIDVSDNGFRVTTGNHNVGTGGAPAAYPSIYAGCHYGNCSTGNGLPQQVSSFTNPQSSVAFSTAAGSWDAAYDIWFDSHPNPTGQNDGEELMIWANHQGPPAPFGSKVGTVSLEGATWDVWEGRQGGSPAWNTVSYVRQSGTNAITVNIKDFTDDSIRRGYLQPSWYMTSVQFGFEPWQGGPGLAVNSFSYTPNGSGGNNGGGGGGGKSIVGQGSGRCLDDQEGGTADGTPVQLYDCYTGAGSWPNQQWTWSNGALVNTTSGKCLDVAGGRTDNGTQVRLWSCNGLGAQKWQANANGTLTNPNSGKCLDAVGRGTANGTPLQIWDCYGGGGTQPNQVWTFR